MSNGTDKMNAANELRKFANGFRSLLAMTDDLEKLGSIENSVVEAQSRIDGLKLQEDAAKERIANMGAEFAQAQADATASASKIINDARSDAEMVRKAAEATAAQMREAAAADVAKATEKLAGVNADLAGGRVALGDLKTEIEQSQSRLDEIKAELAALRRKVG